MHAKARWIVERLRRQSDRPPPGAREFVPGETFHYLGRQHRLRVELDGAPRPVRLEHGWLHVPIPAGLAPEHHAPFVRAALVDWYKHRADRKRTERARLWSKRIRVGATIGISEPRKRWGSASPSGVRINWRIIQAPLSLVDYVVAHELTHLLHPNHTRDFWAALGRVMPDYDARKTRLRAIGSRFDW